MDIKKREDIEWLNYWIENADSYKKRILLLGDSVTREIRKKMQFYLKREYAVDLIAMSYCILDCMALEEIKHYFQTMPYQYKYIFYQMGAHHGYHIACAESVEDSEKFESRTAEILQFLKCYSLNVIVLSLTPERDCDLKGNQLLNHNKEIAKRNWLIEKAAKKVKINSFNLNKKIDTCLFQYLDWCHFSEECYEKIAEILIAEFFPDIRYVSSNQIKTVRELDRKLELYEDKKIYIYGNSIRGRRIRAYLDKHGFRFDGFIVSNEYKEASDQLLDINDIENDNALVIATPVEMEVWEKLDQKKIDYITLHAEVNTFLKMDTDII